MATFNKTQRLVTKSDYGQVFSSGKKFVSDHFILLSRKNDLSHARLGLAISKKSVSKAHERNRLKRILRESFRQMNLPAVDVVFLARNGVSNQTNSVIDLQLSKTWDKLTSFYVK